MPLFYSVVVCSNRAERDRVRFFRIPASFKDRGIKLNDLSLERREAWIRALKRGPLADSLRKRI